METDHQPNKNNQNLPLQICITITTDEEKNEFLLLKKFYGLTNNTEMLRFLIRKEAKQITVTPPQNAILHHN
ncbi:MAG: hypothetical protein FWD52_04740 [Candidatus Bathyarchaeota archaeon]|nr:hypothetical protein [Candidatus Termiticorpusculum sp.]